MFRLLIVTCVTCTHIICDHGDTLDVPRMTCYEDTSLIFYWRQVMHCCIYNSKIEVERNILKQNLCMKQDLGKSPLT